MDVSAHYVIRADDGALIDVQSDGIRRGTPEVMERLTAGEAVPHDQYFFRTLIRFSASAPRWLHLNTVMAIGVVRRERHTVSIDVYRLT
jgi:hypothetical protein